MTNKIYRITEKQIHLIRENVMREEPNQFTKGDTVIMLAPSPESNIPRNAAGMVLHVDAAGTVTVDFSVRGSTVRERVNPDIDKIIKWHPD